MKCPICGQELRPGKKDPNYLLCYNCKKKFKIPQSAHKVQKRAEKPEPEEQKYSNIPPKEVPYWNKIESNENNEIIDPVLLILSIITSPYDYTLHKLTVSFF